MRAYHGARWCSDWRKSRRTVLNVSLRSTVGTGRGEVILLLQSPDLTNTDVSLERNETRAS